MTRENLTRTLDTIAATGGRVSLWLRDDDAVAPTPALDHLLALAGGNGVPVTLAVIPRDTGAALADRLRPCGAAVRVAVHGWAHANHAGLGQKKQELGPHRPAATVLAELAGGRAKLAGLYGPQFLDLLVPPWNRIAPEVVAGLAGIGFRALSTFGGEAAPEDGIQWINTHVDPIDWHGTGSLRDADTLWAELAERAGLVARTGGTVGLLTHHRVHDAAVWDFVAEVLTLTSRHPACRWITPDAVIPGLVTSSSTSP